MACMVNDSTSYTMICRVFSLPSKFDRLEHIGNNIPNIVFNSITHLKLEDKNAFKHKCFIRLTRAFPFLINLSIWNIKSRFLEIPEYHLRDKDWCSIVEYLHLISLDIEYVNIDYVEYLLNETKAHLSRLTELIVTYENWKMVTKNFTRDEICHGSCVVVVVVVKNNY